MLCPARGGVQRPRLLGKRPQPENQRPPHRQNFRRTQPPDADRRRPVIRPPGQDYISSVRIRRRVRELGRSIRRFYKNRPLTVVALLKGSVFFVVDLLRHLEPSTEVEFWTVSSYRGTRSTGRLHGLKSCRGNFRGRDVLLIDDILDSGLTLAHTRSHAKRLGARQVEVCVLLNKKRKRVRTVSARWVGFHITDRFVIGYGLDMDQRYRALPSIRALPEGV
ncbi:MAG: hypoxanthine phosphoribosyltransferase [Verrucomicrobia bacterium]|nr:hypoxanthine phosphoribosyltransferase [Verrucomicrobiota bacterium]